MAGTERNSPEDGLASSISGAATVLASSSVRLSATETVYLYVWGGQSKGLLLTMLSKELAFAVPINTNVGTQADDLSTPKCASATCLPRRESTLQKLRHHLCLTAKKSAKVCRKRRLKCHVQGPNAEKMKNDESKYHDKLRVRHLPQLTQAIVPQQRVLEARFKPQSEGKCRVLDLESVVDADGLATLGPTGCCCQRQGLEERDVTAAERAGEKTRDEDDVVGAGRVRCRREVCDGQGWREGWPGGWCLRHRLRLLFFEILGMLVLVGHCDGLFWASADEGGMMRDESCSKR